MAKLSWDPPKWKSYSFDGFKFKVELETGEIYQGIASTNFVVMRPIHLETCHKIFGIHFTKEHSPELTTLSKILDLTLGYGYWPEHRNITEFLKRYYERVAKIGTSFTKSIISIESEIDITPKFTL